MPNSLAAALPEVGSSKPDAILSAYEVRKSFGGLQAVDVTALHVQTGVITALIGPNGAGKTTFFNVLTSFDRPDSGTWSLRGKDVTRKPPHALARSGMVRTFQLTKALARLSILENMLLGVQAQRGERILAGLLPSLWKRQEAASRAIAMEKLERFNLVHVAHDLAGTLSGGQRRLLEMARALMANPDIVLLDEPMAGVNPALRQTLLGHVMELRDQGMTIVFVEHDMDAVMGIADWVVCMAEGRIIAEGPPRHVGANPVVIDAYLGTRGRQMHPAQEPTDEA